MTTGQGIAVLGIWLGAGIMAAAVAGGAAFTGDPGAMSLILPIGVAAAVGTFFVA